MKTEIYLEVGSKRVFAGALEWPGWSRSGRDEASALQALIDYGPRYGAAIGSARLSFHPARDISDLVVVERLKGDATTDFGAPGRIPARDAGPVNEAELRRLQSLLRASWRLFDLALRHAKGKSLRAGPRGGGRDRQKIMAHVLMADQGYLSKLGWKAHLTESAAAEAQLAECREEILKGLAAAAHGELPAHGPRGGLHWPARYFVRRSAWHVLDHAWEIEDRLK